MPDGVGGLASWLMGKLQGNPKTRPRLTILERITLAPRQSLALVEAEGRRFLVVTSQESGPVLYPLDSERERGGLRNLRGARKALRAL
jgi:flagellar biogenesis protein FliO